MKKKQAFFIWMPKNRQFNF